jgi:hypothetical protein
LVLKFPAAVVEAAVVDPPGAEVVAAGAAGVGKHETGVQDIGIFPAN